MHGQNYSEGPPQVKYKKFTFQDCHNNLDSVTVKIPEVMDPSYGMYIWPSAPVLAQFVWYHRDNLQEKYVIELGAGSSLPGIIAAKVGAKVTLSDSEDLPKCLENCKMSISANNLQEKVKIIGLTWGQYSKTLAELEPVDVILSSDCFYDTKDFEDIIVTVVWIIEKAPHAEFWTTYQVRNEERTLQNLLLKWGLECYKIPLESFRAESNNLAGSELPGDHTIEMYVIKLSK